MRFLSDSRAQSVQIGAVLLFGVLIILLSTWQAFVIPDQNEGIEFNHNGEVQQQMTELRSTVLSMPGADTTRSVTVNLGLRYPSRTVFRNPPPVSGTVQTLDTTDPAYNITIANAQAENDDLAQLWAQEGSRYNTGAVEYRPSYNQYQNAPRTIYAHSVLYNKFEREGQQLPITGQSLIRGDEISLVALNGTLTETRVDSASVDFEPVSTQTRKVEITPDGGPITLEIPTRLNESRWETLLVAEDNVASVSVDQAAIPDEELGLLSIELEDGSDAPDSYTLQLAKVGLGTSVTQEQQAYVTDVAGNGSVIQRGETQALTVEVRDQFNKPLTGTQINASAEGGVFGNSNPTTTATTGSEGQATLQYTGTDVGDNDINVTIESFQPNAGDPFDTTTPTNLTATVTVERQPTSGGGGGSGAYNVTWVNPETDSQVTCSPSSPDPPETCTIDANASSYPLDLTMETDPIADGADVTYSVSNQTVGTVDPNSGVTDSAGTDTTTLNVTENGTVNTYVNSGSSGDRIEFTVKNIIDKDTTPPTISSYQATNPSGTTVEVSFDSDEQLSNIDVGVTNDTYSANITSFTEVDNGGTYTYTGSVDVGGTGQYTAVLNTAEDTAGNDGASGESDTVTIGAGNSAPTASFTESPSDPKTGETVTFDGSGSSDSDGTIQSYSWDFGDGSSDTGEVVDHTYSDSGTYTVTLTVTDDDGATSSASKDITVTTRPLFTAVSPDPDYSNDDTEFMRVQFPSEDTDQWTIEDEDSVVTIGQNLTGERYFAKDKQAFVMRWGIDESLVIEDGVGLANTGGEYLRLKDASGSVLDEFGYNGQTTSNNWDLSLDETDVAVRKTDPSTGAYTDTNTANDWRIENETTFFGGENGAPAVTSASITNAPINYSDAGETQTVTVNFNESMNQAIDPTVTITDMPQSNDKTVSGGWVDATTWEGTVSLARNDEDTTATIEVAGAEDEFGKTQSPDPDTSNTFVLDTLRPEDPDAVRITTDPITRTNEDSVTVEVDLTMATYQDGGTVYVKLTGPDGASVTGSAAVNTGDTTTTVTGINASTLSDGNPSGDGGVTATARVVDDVNNENPSGFTTESDGVLKDTEEPVIERFFVRDDSTTSGKSGNVDPAYYAEWQVTDVSQRNVVVELFDDTDTVVDSYSTTGNDSVTLTDPKKCKDNECNNYEVRITITDSVGLTNTSSVVDDADGSGSTTKTSQIRFFEPPIVSERNEFNRDGLRSVGG